MNTREQTHRVRIGGVEIGGGAPVAINAMTDTDTADPAKTAAQVAELARAGADIIRITVDRPESARALPFLVEKIEKMGASVPLVGDFHFNGHVLLSKYPEAAKSLQKIRINPGNIGRGATQGEKNFGGILDIAAKHGLAVRIGGNGGSVSAEALEAQMQQNAKRKQPLDAEMVLATAVAKSVLKSEAFALSRGFPASSMVLSAKISTPQAMAHAYRMLARFSRAPLHLGLTEAGPGERGAIASAVALGPLLAAGLGDTIRVSLTPRPNESRAHEVHAARAILESADVRRFSPSIVSCPGCGRTTGNAFRDFAEMVERRISKDLPSWKQRFPAAHPEQMRLAVMGCVVNGPGEARNADVGVFFPGRGEGTVAQVYLRGQLFQAVSGQSPDDAFFRAVETFLSGQ